MAWRRRIVAPTLSRLVQDESIWVRLVHEVGSARPSIPLLCGYAGVACSVHFPSSLPASVVSPTKEPYLNLPEGSRMVATASQLPSRSANSLAMAFHVKALRSAQIIE